MINQTEISAIIAELGKRHPEYPVSKYIEIGIDGQIIFKTGLIPNEQVWEEFRWALGIISTRCEDTYPKKN